MKRHIVAAVLFFSITGLMIAMASSANSDPGGQSGQNAGQQAQVTTLQAQVSALQSNNAALTSAISSLNKSNDALASAISKFQTKQNDSSSPGQVLWTYYQTTEPFTACATAGADPDGCNVGGSGDNILRLINPNGSANSTLAGGPQHFVCAMIYVFDDDQEMGECCGCPLTSTQVATFSVEQNLTANFITGGTEEGGNGNGSIAIVAASQNPSLLAFGSSSNGHFCTVGQSGACNFGCDPTNAPGYKVTADNNLLGTITHNQQVGGSEVNKTGLTEVGLSDDGAGDPANLKYLQAQCGALVGNSTGSGICNCPAE